MAASPDLRTLALQRVPSVQRQSAAQVVDLLTAGYGLGEAAQRLEMPRQSAAELRDRVKTGMLSVLAEDGYSLAEASLYMGVPTASIARFYPAAQRT